MRPEAVRHHHAPDRADQRLVNWMWSQVRTETIKKFHHSPRVNPKTRRAIRQMIEKICERVPSIRAKALSRHSSSPQCFPASDLREVEDRSSETLMVNQLSADRSANHRYGLTFGHDSSIRIPVWTGTRAPNQSFGLACADQRHPRAALDTNDLWIPSIRA